MKTFKLTIFKGHDAKHVKTVEASNIEELKQQKNGFWSESPYRRNNPKNWMGVKRVR